MTMNCSATISFDVTEANMRAMYRMAGMPYPCKLAAAVQAALGR